MNACLHELTPGQNPNLQIDFDVGRSRPKMMPVARFNTLLSEV